MVRFGSFPRPIPAGSEIKGFGLVRFGRFGLVSYSFLLLCMHGEHAGVFDGSHAFAFDRGDEGVTILRNIPLKMKIRYHYYYYHYC